VVAALAVPAGLIFGSFATVVAHRVPRRESFVAGRSRCPHCGSTIAAYDNIPVVSWLLLRGRCRNCREAIPARYPLTELTMAALFVATVLILGTDDATELALGLTFCALLVVVTLTDLERRVIPNAVLAAGAVAAVAIAAIGDPSSLPDRAIAAAAAGGFLLLVALVYPRGMGMGDVKLVAMLGLYLGRAVGPAILIALALGVVVGAAIIARKGTTAGRKTAVPFGPFLAVGGLIAYFVGDAIVDGYLDRF